MSDIHAARAEAMGAAVDRLTGVKAEGWSVGDYVEFIHGQKGTIKGQVERIAPGSVLVRQLGPGTRWTHWVKPEALSRVETTGDRAPGDRPNLRRVLLVDDLQQGLASHPLTWGLTVREMAELAAHLAKTIREGQEED